MATTRGYGPWTVVTEFGRAAQLSREAGDYKLELSEGLIPALGWLEMGDLERARQLMLSWETRIIKTQDAMILMDWRYFLAWILCESSDKLAWEQADTLAAPLLADTNGMSFYPIFGRDIIARLAFRRGQFEKAVEEARIAMQMFAMMPVWLTHTASVLIGALCKLKRASEATAIAEQVLGAIPELGATGHTEVEFRLSTRPAISGIRHQRKLLPRICPNFVRRASR